MLKDYKWAGKSYVSSFGGYGHTQYFASPAYHQWMQILGWLILGGMLLALLLRGNKKIQTLFAFAFFCCFLVVAISFITSWIRILQPQGRYLAPILPILGMLFYQVKPYIFSRFTHFLILAMFAMSVYSFLFVGLADIPKGFLEQGWSGIK